MAKTKIEWATDVWNPILGCTKVSPGCDGCYAILTANMRRANPNPKIAAAYAGLVERTDTEVDWTGQINLLEQRLTQPLGWEKPRHIFVNSQSDLFHKGVPDDYIARVFAVMALAERHTFQVLTKRHDRMRSLLNSGHFVAKVWGEVDKLAPGVGAQAVSAWPSWPRPNIWMGVSVEDQKRADLRIPALLETPAAVRFLSCEPLLGPVDLHGPLVNGHRPRLTYWLTGRPDWNSDGHIQIGPRIDWVIVGGESGPGARPMHPEWARKLRNQCVEADVPFFFKQWGEWQHGSARPGQRGETHIIVMDGRHEPWLGHTRDDGLPATDLAHLRYGNKPGTEFGTLIARVGKKRAGRELDGRTWDQMPEVTR